MRTIRLIALLLTALLLPRCALLDEAVKRLNILMVQFGFEGVGVQAAIPSEFEAVIQTMQASGLLKSRSDAQFDFEFPNLFDPAHYLDQTGVDIVCRIAATNPNDNEAAFDGADFLLRVQDTSRTAPADTARVAAFSLDGGASDTLVVPFEIRMNDPVFSRAVLEKIIRGEDIPYNVGANLFFSLVAPDGMGGSDTLGGETLELDLVSHQIATRPSEGMVSVMLDALALFAQADLLQ